MPETLNKLKSHNLATILLYIYFSILFLRVISCLHYISHRIHGINRRSFMSYRRSHRSVIMSHRRSILTSSNLHIHKLESTILPTWLEPPNTLYLRQLLANIPAIVNIDTISKILFPKSHRFEILTKFPRKLKLTHSILPTSGYRTLGW